ncbi:MAG TPA: sigma-70 family RNA polymerase sigma factor [Vicinamibacteria bacterium]
MRECLDGSPEAWAALVEKYQNLIFSIPIKQSIPRPGAADIVQSVCRLLLAELPNLHGAGALPAWLIGVTSKECLRWRRQEHPYAAREGAEAESAPPADSPVPEELLAQVRQEQIVRDAVRALPARCRRLIEIAFFEAPAGPYREIARSLGLAAGGGPCLARLRRELTKRGFR